MNNQEPKFDDGIGNTLPGVKVTVSVSVLDPQIEELRKRTSIRAIHSAINMGPKIFSGAKMPNLELEGDEKIKELIQIKDTDFLVDALGKNLDLSPEQLSAIVEIIRTKLTFKGNISNILNNESALTSKEVYMAEYQQERNHMFHMVAMLNPDEYKRELLGYYHGDRVVGLKDEPPKVQFHEVLYNSWANERAEVLTKIRNYSIAELKIALTELEEQKSEIEDYSSYKEQKKMIEHKLGHMEHRLSNLKEYIWFVSFQNNIGEEIAKDLVELLLVLHNERLHNNGNVLDESGEKFSIEDIFKNTPLLTKLDNLDIKLPDELKVYL